jgi:hypothetical protein
VKINLIILAAKLGKAALDKIHAHPEWIGIPGKSLRSIDPEIFDKALQSINDLI